MGLLGSARRMSQSVGSPAPCPEQSFQLCTAVLPSGEWPGAKLLIAARERAVFCHLTFKSLQLILTRMMLKMS